MNVIEFFSSIHEKINCNDISDGRVQAVSTGEIKKGPMLGSFCSFSGIGKNWVDALNDYARQISGEKLVFNAYSDVNRKEYDVPKLDKIDFPKVEPERKDIDYWRYKFAGMAMQGLLSNSTLEKWGEDVFDKKCEENGLSEKEIAEKWEKATAFASVKFADVLIARLQEVK